MEDPIKERILDVRFYNFSVVEVKNVKAPQLKALWEEKVVEHDFPLSPSLPLRSLIQR